MKGDSCLACTIYIVVVVEHCNKELIPFTEFNGLMPGTRFVGQYMGFVVARFLLTLKVWTIASLFRIIGEHCGRKLGRRWANWRALLLM